MREIKLPGKADVFETFSLRDPVDWPALAPGESFNRIALSAAHVVADSTADISPFQQSAIDMEATLRYRRYLLDLGLGIAEAMDTAQRGMGLNWEAAQTVIRETLGMARDMPSAIVFTGVGTDHLGPGDATLDEVRRAYHEQAAFLEGLGGRTILMASRALTMAARSPADYAAVYGDVLRNLDRPAILHWLGPMFDPALEGYWGEVDINRAMDVCLQVIHDNAAKVDGIKISLLDKSLEISLRRRLPAGVRMYTGDDFNYAELIAGDEHGYSHALLGVFDAIAPAASAALAALAKGDEKCFREILDPTVALSRELFAAPTQFYKTGVVFLAYLNGHQDHFIMLGGQQSARSLPHLTRVFRLAADTGLLRDPDLAADRMKHVLAVHGFVG